MIRVWTLLNFDVAEPVAEEVLNTVEWSILRLDNLSWIYSAYIDFLGVQKAKLTLRLLKI